MADFIILKENKIASYYTAEEHEKQFETREHSLSIIMFRVAPIFLICLRFVNVIFYFTFILV